QLVRCERSHESCLEWCRDVHGQAINALGVDGPLAEPQARERKRLVADAADPVLRPAPPRGRWATYAGGSSWRWFVAMVTSWQIVLVVRAAASTFELITGQLSTTASVPAN